MHPHSRRNFLGQRVLLWQITILLFVTSCSGGGDDSDDSLIDNPFPDGGVVGQLSTVADGGGVVSATIAIPAGSNKVSITAVTAASGIRFDEVFGDQGVVFFDRSSEELSLGQTYQTVLGTITVPSRNIDPSLSSSNLRLRLTAINEDSSGSLSLAADAPVSILVRAKADSNLSAGMVTANLFLVGSTAQSTALRTVIDQAKSVMTEIYSSSAAISISFNEFAIEGPEILPNPYNGSAFYETTTSSAPTPALNVFLAADIGGESAGLLGVAGSIPGPSFATSKSAVAISILASAGPDGSFSENEIRLFGETMSHESGHFMGLYHPVDFNPFTGLVSDVDPLPDTADCRSQSTCLQDSSIIANLMFPFPVTTISGDYIPQSELSNQQRGVLNRYIAVD